ncbi:predicted protein [Naegleria gruberi]|uniref:Predicted protein n=1 Tax=Naegleria gruberi TaxID=5762 RepID=D2VRY3_NAEGR|nr:uncharacterized protein NAEGRDRAFT_51783 [Naegleria gruberi]EFC40471.1 predicted protein [Naegleria gruberi]|eukprot:XP_002673215.1 predicted protein [Naegleria gruberi strain NEG-M]
MLRSKITSVCSSRQFINSFGKSSLFPSLNTKLHNFHSLQSNRKSNSSDIDAKSIIKSIKVPEMGNGIRSATISRWKKHPGDECDGSDVLAELEMKNSDMKLLLELRPPVKGQVREHLKNVGDEVMVGEKIATMETLDIDEESRLRHVVEDAIIDVHVLPK